jgi:hypothetical protein
VFAGRQLSDAALVRAAHGLAARILAGEFGALRLSPVLTWVNVVTAIGFAVAGSYC